MNLKEQNIITVGEWVFSYMKNNGVNKTAATYEACKEFGISYGTAVRYVKLYDLQYTPQKSKK